MKTFLADFRKFVMRGNIVDLAVAVIIGVAFNAVIQSLVNDIVSPIIGAFFGKPNFDDLTFKLGDGVIRYGAFITALINFLIIAFVLVRRRARVHAHADAAQQPERRGSREVREGRARRDPRPARFAAGRLTRISARRR